jgi:hypothetical protein
VEKAAEKTLYEKAAEYATSKIGQQVISSVVSGAGSAIQEYYKGKDKEKLSKEEREWKARNMNIENMPKINWTTRRVGAETPASTGRPAASIGSTAPQGTTVVPERTARSGDDYTKALADSKANYDRITNTSGIIDKELA